MRNESGGEQFKPNGEPLWSPTKDVGIMQINSSWLSTSKKMGLDIVNNAQDNIEFGVWLYQKYGPTQWTTYRKYCSSKET